MAAAVAAYTWMTIEWVHKGKGTILGACTGAVAGLVAITPCAGFVTPMGAVVVGALVCVVCYGAILLKGKLGYDDSLDVFGVHGVGGFGALAVGMLAKAGISSDVNGLIHGNPAQLGYQALSVVAAGAYSFIGTFAILKLVDVVVGLRVSTEEEEVGLDLTQHGERGYIMGVELSGDRRHVGTAFGSTASVPVAEPTLFHVSR
jgi:Amt family ammonium transporter